MGGRSVGVSLGAPPSVLACAAAVAAGSDPVGRTAVAALAGLAAAIAVVLVVTPLVRRFALRVGAVDRPGARSVHRVPVPYLGGVAIFAGLIAGLAAVAVVHPGVLAGNGLSLVGIALGGLCILALGVADDLGRLWVHRVPWLGDAEGRGLRPAPKLVAEVAAALILCASGLRIPDIHLPFGQPCAYIMFGPAAQYALTVTWVVAITNAVNLIDGLDGLAAGVSAISAGTLLVVAVLNPSMGLAVVVAAVVLGAAAGFLPFNFHPARIFMGDGGALLLGFALSAVSLIEPLKSPTLVTLALPILALGVPILDTGLAILRRLGRRQLVGSADRAHVHHRLLDLGLGQRDAVLSLYVASGWLGVAALAALNVRAHLDVLFTVLLSTVGRPLLGALAAAGAGAALATPLAGRLLRRSGDRAAPPAGGIALFVAFGLGLVAASLLGAGAVLPPPRVAALLLGGLVMLGVGLADDAAPHWTGGWARLAGPAGLRPGLRLLGEAAAALVLCAAGVRVPDIHMPFSGNPARYLVFGPVAQYALTTLWVLAVTSAMRFMDGLDGLPAGISAISAAALLGAALLTPGLGDAAVVAGAVCAASAGFLPFNLHPARVRTGSGGALLLGFALSSISVVGPLKGATVVTLAVPVLATGVPVFDTLLTVARRWRAGGAAPGLPAQSLHDRLVGAGLGPRRSVGLLCAASALLGIGVLAVEGFVPSIGVAVFLFVVACGVLGARLTGPAVLPARERGS